ncbi:MAG: helix-turn-helix domain-containing protein [Bacilli bacterium]
MLLYKIKDLRDEHDLNQIQMAKIIGVSKSNYARWETDENIIPLKHLNNVCNYFDVSMDYMLGLSNNKNYKNVNKKLNKELIGKRLKTFRIENNLTQEALAREINTSHSTISAYETGKTILLTAFAYDIAKKYNVSMDWLCGRID